MDRNLRSLLDQIENVPDFAGIRLKDINDTNAFGDNALHCVCVWGQLEAAKLLFENGINVDQKGEGGFTPLKVADEFGFQDIVNYLISVGADTQALHAEFQFDPEVNAKHMSNLQEEVIKLEKHIESHCDKNA